MRLAALLVLLLVPVQDPPARLVVHEWGTFTTVSGAEGAALEWRPLAGPSDLPSFVYSNVRPGAGLRWGKACDSCGHHGCGCGKSCDGPNCKCKSCYTATVRMETPVIYFYADRELKVDVQVGFPGGQVTEWYPQARTVGSGIHWGGLQVRPGATEPLPREAADSHYYPARETDAAPVRVCGGAKPEHEKFLFYRGVGTFDLPVKAFVDGDQVSAHVTGLKPVAAILFENRAGACGFARLEIGTSWTVVPRPATNGSKAAVEAELHKLLVASGLYEKEARAMIATWTDSWFEEGLRVFYLLPRDRTDFVLPLRVDPAPAELVRTMVGRLELLTVERRKEIEIHAARLADESLEVREEATRALLRIGRFAEPILKEILGRSRDPEIQSRIRHVIGGGK